jgi:hypothetical protein
MALAPFTRAAVVMAAFAAALVPPEAAACSTCKCGDYTITLLGAEKPFGNRFRLGLDTILRSEAQGEPGVDERKTDEWRTLLGIAYSPTENLTFAVQVPFVRKEIEDTDLARQEAEGLGDIDLIGRWVLYRKGAVSGRHLAGLRFGVRLPTAEQVEDDNGNKLDIDVQPDAGATVPNLGGWYSYFRFPWFFTASATWFSFSGGHQDFSPGDAAVASALVQYGVAQGVALQLGVDARYSKKNQFSGIDDGDSGGTLAMAFGGVAVRFLEDFVANAAVQIPVVDNLNGHQDEDPSYRLGLAYDF